MKLTTRAQATRKTTKRRGEDEEDKDKEDEGEDDDQEDLLESWVEWLKRSTHESEQKLQKLRLEDWVATYRRTKWQWAGRVAQHDRSRWTYYAMRWQPALHTRQCKLRKQGDPKKRWEDSITMYLSDAGIDGTWYDIARDGDRWDELCNNYVSKFWS